MIKNGIHSFSLCGPTADERGPGQRVVSFAVSGKNLDSEAVGKRVREVRDAYPDDYVIRLYHDIDWDNEPLQVHQILNFSSLLYRMTY